MVKNIFKNFDFRSAITCAFSLLGLTLFIGGIGVAVYLVSWWSLPMMLLAIVCFAIAVGVY